VSEVMGALEETDQYRNTIIVFLSDNGGRRVDTDKPEQGKSYIDLHNKTVLDRGRVHKNLFCSRFLTKIN
jgi:arylsulfatase A-like enzyme